MEERETEKARSGTGADVRGLDTGDVLEKFMEYPLTDIGSSKLYADMFKNKLRFVRELGVFYYYNGNVWIKDVNGVYAKRLAKKFAINLIEKANRIADDEMRGKYVKYYNKFNGYNSREKLVKDAQSVYFIEFSEFDKKSYLYNCQNGTFNLKTGKLQEHNADDLLTQISNVTYDPKAKCERWERFINEVMQEDQASKNLLQMISGYCLSGTTQFECFFMLYGKSTRNGKGTFNSTMMKMHGDYAKVLNPESLTAKSFYRNSEAPNESIANLAGARYVCVSEPGENMVLNSDLVKTLTGGDPIKARFLRQNSFTYIPAFKIVINTNFLPKILDDTIFSSDRLILLNFNAHFDQNSRDNTLKSKLIKPGALSGIFNWCYEGYRMLDNAGKFEIPTKSKALFDKYRDESDTVGQFINECLIKSEGARTKFKSVFDEYKNWTKDNGYKQCSRRTLRGKMEKYAEVKVYHKQEFLLDYEVLEDVKIPFS